MSVAMAGGMHDDLSFLVRSLMCAQGSEFKKMHIEFSVNILERACCAQELEETNYFSTIF
jgi:hypothetical protein